jgi:hypothetical protein
MHATYSVRKVNAKQAKFLNNHKNIELKKDNCINMVQNQCKKRTVSYRPGVAQRVPGS